MIVEAPITRGTITAESGLCLDALRAWAGRGLPGSDWVADAVAVAAGACRKDCSQLGCIHDFHNADVKTRDDLARHYSRRLRTARTRKRRYPVNCFTHGAYIEDQPE